MKQFVYILGCCLVCVSSIHAFDFKLPQPEHHNQKALYTPLGQSVTFLGHSVNYDADAQCRLSLFFHCTDRVGDLEPLSFYLESLFYGPLERLQKEDATLWQIGEVVEVVWPLDMNKVPLGTYQVFGGDLSEPLGDVQFYQSQNIAMFQNWSFLSAAGSKSLDEAIQSTMNVGFLPPHTVWFACGEAPGPDSKVAVVISKSVVPKKQYQVHLEIYDGYGSTSMEGNIEQRIYVNDELVFTHDIGGVMDSGRADGWYDVDFVMSPESAELNVRIEVMPLKQLGPWGWGRASRSQIRNVRILPQ